MDAIFKALNDPARRALLDSLRARDGQSLSDLEAQLDMTRFGVMKHLKVLEEANLVVPRKSGRFKYHYLNALPLQEVIDRWIDPFLAKPAARAVLDLKSQLEGTPPMSAKPDFMMATFIDCTQDALWEALTKGQIMAQHHFLASDVRGDLIEDGEVTYDSPRGGTLLVNTLIKADPKTRIECKFTPHWLENPVETRAVYIIEPQPSSMKLTVEHYDLTPELANVADGWARELAGLKTLLERGEGHRFVFPND